MTGYTKEEKRLYMINYRNKNRERDRAYRKDYYNKNIERIKKVRALYQEKNRDMLREKGRKYYRENTEKARASSRMSSYGISKENFEKMLENQNHNCAICGNKMILSFDRIMDHDHVNGKIREILCRKCNCGIGFFKDKSNIVKLALDYLIKWEKINHA
jgi:hypothetical protein